MRTYHRLKKNFPIRIAEVSQSDASSQIFVHSSDLFAIHLSTFTPSGAAKRGVVAGEGERERDGAALPERF